MKLVVVAFFASAGCSQLFGLEKPIGGAAGDAATDATGDGSVAIDATIDSGPTVCPHDEFDDGTVSAMWTVAGTGVSESGGILHAVIGNSTPVAGVRLLTNVGDATVDVEVVQAITSGAAQTPFTFSFDASNSAGMAVVGAAIVTATKNNGATTNSTSAFGPPPQTWRIAYDATTKSITYSVRASGGGTFSPIKTDSIAPSTSQATIAFGSAALNSGASGESKFDNFLVTRAGCAPPP